MKKMLKKVVAIGLVGIVALSAFALSGCDKKETADNGETVVKWFVPNNKQEDLPKVLAEANKIISAKLPGITLDVQFIDASAYEQRMNMNMAAGADFDICFTSGWLNDYHLAVQRGGLMPLDALMESTPALKEAIPEYAWETAKVNGEIYAVPNMQIMTYANTQYVLKRLADKYGFDPESYNHVEDLEEFLAKVKAGEPDIYPYRANYGAAPWFAARYETPNGVVGIDKNDPESKAVCYWETEEFKRGMNKLREWYQKGYIRADVLSMGDDTADFNAGKYAVWESNYSPGVEAGYYDQLGEEVIALKPYEPANMTTRSAISSMVGISKTSKNPEAAIKIIELVNTDKDLYRLLAYGIEGEHYKKNEDGTIKYIDGSKYAHKGDWKFGSTFNGYPVEGQDPDIFEKVKKFNDDAIKSPLLGFVIDNTTIESELAQTTTVQSEYTLSKGAVDPAQYYDEFIKKHQQAGSQKIVDEVNRQIQEFLKNKK